MTTKPIPSPLSGKTWLWAEAKQAHGVLSLAIGLGLVAGILLIIQASLLAKIVHEVVFLSLKLNEVISTLLLLPLIMVLRAGLVWGAEQLGFAAATRVKSRLRMRLYDHLQAIPQAKSSGELAHQLLDGVEGLEAYYARFLPQAAMAALIPLAVLAFVLPLDLTSGLILLFTAPFIPFFMVLIGSLAEKINQRQWRRLASLSARFLDSLQGLTTLKMFNATQREVEIIARISDDYRKTTVSVLRVAFLSTLMLEFLATISVALVAVIVGFKLLHGTLDFQTGFFILLLAPEFYLPLRALGTHYHSRLSALAAAEGLLKILNQPARKPSSQNLLQPQWPQVALMGENLGFSHNHRSPPLLQGLNLNLPAGGFALISGPSGVGKTTLLRLFLGTLSPEQGRVLANGTDLALVDLAAWTRLLAWMPQNPYFLPGTILENIFLGYTGSLSSTNWQNLNHFAKLTGLDRDLAGLPQTWETRLGESGAGLSGGQRQRLALTRALVKQAPLLLLDEPTAHLDQLSCQAVLATLRGLKGRHTLVVASHDPRLRELADLTLKLGKQGRL